MMNNDEQFIPLGNTKKFCRFFVNLQCTEAKRNASKLVTYCELSVHNKCMYLYKLLLIISWKIQYLRNQFLDLLGKASGFN